MLVSRRKLISQVAGTVAMTNLTVRAVAQLAAAGVPEDDEKFWAAFRGQFQLDKELVLFNNVGLSASPATVMDALVLEQKRANLDPSYYVYRIQKQQLEPIRKRLAVLIGCTPEELAITPNATFGLHNGIMGVDLPEGATVVASAHEYPRALAAIEQKKKRAKIQPHILDLPARPTSADEIWQAIQPSLGQASLGVFSSVTHVNGTLLPVRRICDDIGRGSGMSLVDVAQSVGILSLPFSELGCDMLTACLHKWMMAPVGTGVFCVRKSVIPQVWSLHPAEGELDRVIEKFEHWGTRPVAPVLAIREALDLHETLGLERKAKRVAYLRGYLGERLSSVPGVSLTGSLRPDCGVAPITLEVKGYSGADAASWLLEKHHIHASPVMKAEVNGVRVSPHLFTSLPECDFLVEKVKEMAQGAGASIPG